MQTWFFSCANVSLHLPLFSERWSGSARALVVAQLWVWFLWTAISAGLQHAHQQLLPALPSLFVVIAGTGPVYLQGNPAQC